MAAVVFVDVVTSVVQMDCEFKVLGDTGEYGCILRSKDLTVYGVNEVFHFNGRHANRLNDDNVKTLMFIDTDTTNLPSQLFRQFKNIRYLQFSGNKALKKFGALVLKDAKNVDSLLYTNGALKALNFKAFSGAKKLENLNLLSNEIDEVHQGAFRELDSLKFLNLQNNKIRLLPKNVFDPLIDLQNLDLSNNKIESLDGDLLSRNTVLELLDLSGNQINSIGNNLFKNLRVLSRIRLTGNICANQDFSAIKKNKVNTEVVPNLRVCFANAH